MIKQIKRLYFWYTDRAHRIYLPFWTEVMLWLISFIVAIYARNLPQPLRFYLFSPFYALILYNILFKVALRLLIRAYRYVKYWMYYIRENSRVKVKVTRVRKMKATKPLPLWVDLISNLMASAAVWWIESKGDKDVRKA